MNSSLSTLRFLSSAAFSLLFVWNGSSHAFVPAATCSAGKSTANLKPSSQQNNAAAKKWSLSSHWKRDSSMRQASIINDIPSEEWIPLVDGTEGSNDDISAVRKHILAEGEGDRPSKGSTIELEYTGTLIGQKSWSTTDVVECWLSQLQGLDQLSPKFTENEIDGSKLTNESFFTEEYCTSQLEITNKIQAKKLIMASRRLIKQQEEYPPGTEFDSSISRGKNYCFVLGQGKVIKAMELAVGSMKVGERALLVCRSDYGYGAEGLRTGKGDVMVPPFATLCFELNLVSAASS